MKLFIWEGDGVLTDYTNGQVVALAEDLETALKVASHECNYMSALPAPKRIIDLGECSAKPEPVAAVCWGGG